MSSSERKMRLHGRAYRTWRKSYSHSISVLPAPRVGCVFWTWLANELLRYQLNELWQEEISASDRGSAQLSPLFLLEPPEITERTLHGDVNDFSADCSTFPTSSQHHSANLNVIFSRPSSLEEGLLWSKGKRTSSKNQMRVQSFLNVSAE
jgi:hypothetical protein